MYELDFDDRWSHIATLLSELVPFGLETTLLKRILIQKKIFCIASSFLFSFQALLACATEQVVAVKLFKTRCFNLIYFLTGKLRGRSA